LIGGWTEEFKKVKLVSKMSKTTKSWDPFDESHSGDSSRRIIDFNEILEVNLEVRSEISR
jgi:hypothetical protein